MVSVCLPSDALLQHLPSYLVFSYLGCGVSLHGCAGAGGPRGAVPRSRSGRVAVRRYPSSKVRSSCEEIPHAQGKRNPSKMVGVARGHQRADTLKPYSQKTSQSNHTRTTALSNSMKLSHAHGATQDGRVMVKRFDRMWSTGEGNGKPHFSILALRTP